MKQTPVLTVFSNALRVAALSSLLLLAAPAAALAASSQMPTLLGIRIELILFGFTLFGVALFHHQTFRVALTGLTVILLYTAVFHAGFDWHEKFLGTAPMLEQILHKDMRGGEWGILLNLLGLLLGFAILSRIFEESGVPGYIPRFLPPDWKGPFLLLVCVFVLSSFLDNIAAALIGGTIALVVFRHNVHVGYIAAIVAASNAGGAGSVVGDTTTTMMWIGGVSAHNVLHAFVASAVALLFFAWFAARQQHRHQPICNDDCEVHPIDWGRLLIVLLMLVGAIISNVVYDMPALGVWVAIVIGSTFRTIPWGEVPASFKGTIFLLSLVTCASLMPVEELPDASWTTAFVLGAVSAVFDNIPLTKLCIDQGHYDWGMLAYTVGFGGSMVWFGSSAGVAITNKFPEGRNVFLWIRKGWHIAVAYVIGFFALLL
ncbi:MAG TPA: citrate transporter, partial [Thermodesulfobacteriota bacterium]|nr:citrate transporter [Thermodesulfobacteriota bacterium]